MTVEKTELVTLQEQFKAYNSEIANIKLSPQDLILKATELKSALSGQSDTDASNTSNILIFLQNLTDLASNERFDLFIQQTESLAQNHSKFVNDVVSFYGCDVDSTYRRIRDKFRWGLFFKTPANYLFSMHLSHFKTWYLLKQNLPRFNELIASNAPQNALFSLLKLDDEAFLEDLIIGKLPFGGELGHIAVHRLREIIVDNKQQKNSKSAAKFLSLLGGYSGENMFTHDEAALKLELFKLLYFAETHPNNKIAILGTAKSVEAYRDKFPNSVIYLNPEPSKYSWELNRIWLYVAYKLGFEFKLVEQHFPDIEKALLSNNSLHFIEQLLREIGFKKESSQYHTEGSLTATPQEILFLMDLGCSAVKQGDGTISLKANPSSALRNDLYRPRIIPALRRNHSVSLFQAAPLPYYSTLQEHFEIPTVKM